MLNALKRLPGAIAEGNCTPYNRGPASPALLPTRRTTFMAHSNSAPTSNKDDWTWDNAYLASLRELWIILAFFAVMLSYTIGVSFYLGYPADKNTPMPLIWGIPQWFLLGVAAPWATASVVSVLFAMLYMTDDDSSPEEASELPTSNRDSESRS